MRKLCNRIVPILTFSKIEKHPTIKQRSWQKLKIKKRRIWIYLLILLAIVISILGYYQLFYQPKTVDNGLVKLVSIFKGHENIVTGVRFSPNDSLVITGSIDSTIKIWKKETGEVIRSIRQPQGIT
ncbi:MAG TPA: WD40 repeat domain-containing protein [Chitinophagaceae bacterium]|nr:WD40 repeat domain-containing protein [Chitinophagaceae bacterium]